jgi:hypothetical protein
VPRRDGQRQAGGAKSESPGRIDLTCCGPVVSIDALQLHLWLWPPRRLRSFCRLGGLGVVAFVLHLTGEVGSRHHAQLDAVDVRVAHHNVDRRRRAHLAGGAVPLRTEAIRAGSQPPESECPILLHLCAAAPDGVSDQANAEALVAVASPLSNQRDVFSAWRDTGHPAADPHDGRAHQANLVAGGFGSCLDADPRGARLIERAGVVGLAIMRLERAIGADLGWCQRFFGSGSNPVFARHKPADAEPSLRIGLRHLPAAAGLSRDVAILHRLAVGVHYRAGNRPGGSQLQGHIVLVVARLQGEPRRAALASDEARTVGGDAVASSRQTSDRELAVRRGHRAISELLAIGESEEHHVGAQHRLAGYRIHYHARHAGGVLIGRSALREQRGTGRQKSQETWRTHSCVPRRHSCRRRVPRGKDASRRVSTLHTEVRAPRQQPIAMAFHPHPPSRAASGP